MNNRFLLDSWAILALVYEEQPAAAHIKQLFLEAADGQARLFLSVINLGEIFYIVARHRGASAAEEVVGRVKRLPIHVLQADEQLVLAAARFKATHPVSYADAFAAAASIEVDATLVTGDPELLALEGLQLEPLRRGPD